MQQTLFYHHSSACASDADARGGVEIDPQRVGQRILRRAVTLHPIQQQPHNNMDHLAMRLGSNRRLSLLSAGQRLRLINSRGSSSKNMSEGAILVDHVDSNMSGAILVDHMDSLPPSADTWSLLYNHNLYTIRTGDSATRDIQFTQLQR
jgi:hypothetical protein